MILFKNKNVEQMFGCSTSFSLSLDRKQGEHLKFLYTQGSTESLRTPKPAGCATDWHEHAGCCLPPALRAGVGSCIMQESMRSS